MEFYTRHGKMIKVTKDALNSMTETYKRNINVFKNSNPGRYWINFLEDYDIASAVYDAFSDEIDSMNEDLEVNDKFLNRYFKNISCEPDVVEEEKRIIPYIVYETAFNDKFKDDYLDE